MITTSDYYFTFHALFVFPFGAFSGCFSSFYAVTVCFDVAEDFGLQVSAPIK